MSDNAWSVNEPVGAETHSVLSSSAIENEVYLHLVTVIKNVSLKSTFFEKFNLVFTIAINKFPMKSNLSVPYSIDKWH